MNASMNLVGLVTQVNMSTGFTKSDIETILRSAFFNIKAHIDRADIEDTKVSIPNFGKFISRVREERVGHHPKTGKPIIIPRKKGMVFKASKTGLVILTKGRSAK